MDCDVLRCGNPFQSIFNVGTPGSGPIDVRLCAEHRSQIDQGARWLYPLDERASQAHVLMGRDLPPRVAEVKTKAFLSAGGITRIFTFVLEDHEGSQRDVEFELPPEIAAGIKRISDRGR